MLNFVATHFFLLLILLARAVSIMPVCIDWQLWEFVGYNKGVLFISEIHDLPRFIPLEKEQLHRFVEELRKYSQALEKDSLTEEEWLDILIEHAGPPEEQENLLESLMGILAKEPLKNVTIKNSEVRCASKCIRNLLPDENIDRSLIDPRSICSSATHTYFITKVTLQEARDEYTCIMANLDERAALIKNKEVLDIYQRHKEFAEKEYEFLDGKYFIPLKDELKEPLINLILKEPPSTRPSYINHAYIERMLWDIYEASCSLFCYSLFVEIFTSNAPLVAVIAGVDHIDGLRGMFCYLFNKKLIADARDTIPNYYDFKNGTDIPVLQPSEFAFFEKRLEKIKEKPTYCVLL